MGVMGMAFRRFWSRLYRPHVGLEFPADMVLREREALPPMQAAYSIRQPPLPGDAQAVADLLNEEPGFGQWTADRVQRELAGRMAHPGAGMLVLHNGTPVATAFATDETRSGTRTVHGMYLYVTPEHRRRAGLAATLVFEVFGSCLDAGYSRLLAFTDPTRYPALQLYLSRGARPVYVSLGCYWHWWRIDRHLRSSLRQTAKPGAAACRPDKAA